MLTPRRKTEAPHQNRSAPEWSPAPADVHRRLVGELNRYRQLAIAVSGGIDSLTLAYVAHRDSDCPATMVHAVSPAVPPSATARVQTYAKREGWQLNLVEAGEFADPPYLANPVNRCYFCKSNLYSRINLLTAGPIASGANVDDLGDYRPGLTAAAEYRVVHPYIDSDIDKDAIRALARWLGLGDIAELPAQPCLASRVETGLGINADDLSFIDEVEQTLRQRFADMGTVRCRITHTGVVIEVGGEARVTDDEIAAAATPLCIRDGRSFAGVRPYRQGSAFLRPIGAQDSMKSRRGHR